MEKRPTKEEKEQVLQMFKKALDDNDAELFFVVINAVTGFTLASVSKGKHGNYEMR